MSAYRTPSSADTAPAARTTPPHQGGPPPSRSSASLKQPVDAELDHRAGHRAPDTWLGAAGCASGSHTWSGTSPAFEPNPREAPGGTPHSRDRRAAGSRRARGGPRIRWTPPPPPGAGRPPSASTSPPWAMARYQSPACAGLPPIRLRSARAGTRRPTSAPRSADEGDDVVGERHEGSARAGRGSSMAPSGRSDRKCRS